MRRHNILSLLTGLLRELWHGYRRIILVATLFLASFVTVVGLANVTPALDHQGTELSPQMLIEQSQRLFVNGNLPGAIHNQQKAVDLLRQVPDQQVNVAISLTNLGRLNLQAGHFNAAYNNFTEADSLYPVVDRNRLQNRGYQAQALRKLGQYQVACLMMVKTLGIGDSLSSERSLCQTGDIENTGLNLLEPLITQQPEALQAQLLRELGISLRVLGHLDAAERVLSQFTDVATMLSLANTKRAQGNLIRDRLASPRYDAMPWRFDRKSLPNTRVGRNGEPSQNYQEMQKYYSEAQGLYSQIEKQENSNALRTQAKLNHLSLMLDQIALLDEDNFQDEKVAQAPLALLQTIDVNYLPVGQPRVFAQISVAKYQVFLNHLLKTEPISQRHIEALLDNAKNMAEALDNPYVLSYVLGNQGSLYEYFAFEDQKRQRNGGVSSNAEPLKSTSLKMHHGNNVQWRDRAAQLTQQALMKAQPIDAPTIAYQWQWQLGRLDMIKGNREGAIAHYNAAVETLEAARKDLLNINTDVRFSFRDNVEPVYRGLVDALLTDDPSTQDIEKAVEVIDGLQLAELESFLRCNLGDALQVNRDLEHIDDKAAFIYPIILRDRLEVIVQFPEQKIESYPQFVSSEIIESKIYDFQDIILNDRGVLSNKSNSLIYQWLFGAIEKKIEEQFDVRTVVFVPDSAFRNLSITALYDEDTETERGGEYVLEKEYATVLLPSSQLFNLDKPRQKLKILAVGIDEAQVIDGRAFNALKAQKEIQSLKAILPNTESLLNTQAKLEEINNRIQSTAPSVLHFATHGDFSSDPNETFIVLYQELLQSYKFKTFLEASSKNRNGLDLLTLGACRTATGDNRAILGIAGMAIQAGSKSTLSSLWKVDDVTTSKLMISFYQALSDPEVTTVEALHRAQLSIYRDETTSNLEPPKSWAPFLLVGAWL